MSACIEIKYINPNSLIHMCVQTTFFPNILPPITHAVFHLTFIWMLEVNPYTFGLSRVVQIQTFLPRIPFICENGCYDHQSRGAEVVQPDLGGRPRFLIFETFTYPFHKYNCPN